MNANYQEYYRSLHQSESSLAKRIDLWENKGLRKLVCGIQVGSAVIGLIGIVAFTIGCLASAGIIGGVLGAIFIASRVSLLIAISMGIICLASTFYKAMADMQATLDTKTASFKKSLDDFDRLSRADFEAAWSVLNRSQEALSNGEDEEAQEIIRRFFETNVLYDTYITFLVLIKKNDLIEEYARLVEIVNAVFEEYTRA